MSAGASRYFATSLLRYFATSLLEIPMKKMLAGVLVLISASVVLADPTIVIEHPIEGNGPQWDCHIVDGFSDELPTGTPAQAKLYKKIGSPAAYQGLRI